MNDYSDYLEILQDNLKSILSLMILINFGVIFILRFSIKLKEKLAALYDLKKEDFNKLLELQKETLIITAHPDDEIMFFTPTITYLLRHNCKIRILCLSNGNYSGEGRIREKEMDNLCAHLNIPYTIINNDKLKDNINIKWDSVLISEILTEYLKDKDIGTFITFDENGITSHPNHISCYEGLVYIYLIIVITSKKTEK